MSRAIKYSSKIKLNAVQEFQSGLKTAGEIGADLKVDPNVIRRWSRKFEVIGSKAFDTSCQNRQYTKEQKIEAVNAYLSGEGSLIEISLSRGISSTGSLFQWITKYNSHIELKDYDPKGDVYMTKTRETTHEERLAIVKFCLEHEKRYKETATAYRVPYSQVYMWVRKYQAEGEDGLLDRRGRHKMEAELTDFEKLQRENKLLKQRNDDLKMENELLKKVEEIERRRHSAGRGKKRAI